MFYPLLNLVLSPFSFLSLHSEATDDDEISTEDILIVLEEQLRETLITHKKALKPPPAFHGLRIVRDDSNQHTMITVQSDLCFVPWKHVVVTQVTVTEHSLIVHDARKLPMVYPFERFEYGILHACRTVAHFTFPEPELWTPDALARM